MLNTQQYLEVRKEAFKNNNKIPGPSDAYDLLLWDSTRYTDWQRSLYDNVGKRTGVKASVSGGDNLNTFRISAGYDHIKNILTVSGADQRASLAVNFNHRSTDQRFSISFFKSILLYPI